MLPLGPTMQSATHLLHCIASAQVSAYPQKVHLLRHPSAGVVVIAITHDSNALSLSQVERGPALSTCAQKKKRTSFFTIAEIKVPNLCSEPMRVMKVRVPKNCVVSSLTLVPCGEGKDLYVLVQCVESSSGSVSAGSLFMNKTHSYLYKRVEEVVESKDGLLDEVILRKEVIVTYQRLPNELNLSVKSSECTDQHFGGVCFPWSSSTFLAGWEEDYKKNSQSASWTSPIVAASTPPGQATALHVLQVAGTRTRVVYSVEIEALSQFPISAMLPIPGFAPRFLGICHNCVVELDLGKVEGASMAAVCSSNTLLTRAWRCASEVPLVSIAVRDHLLLAGSATGTVLLWELRDAVGVGAPKAAAQVHDSVSPITGLYASDASTFFTCSLDGKFFCWQSDCLDAYGSEPYQHNGEEPPTCHFPFAPTEIPILAVSHGKEMCAAPWYQNQEGWVSMAGEGNILAVLGEHGSLYLFIRT